MGSEPEFRREWSLELPREMAFSLVVDHPDLWWRLPFSSDTVSKAETGIEPFPGGCCYTIDGEGTRWIWGTVLSIEQPLYLRIAWQIAADGSCIPDPATCSRVMFNFRNAGATTRLEVVHTEFLRHGEEGSGYLQLMRLETGWPAIISSLKTAALKFQEHPS